MFISNRLSARVPVACGVNGLPGGDLGSNCLRRSIMKTGMCSVVPGFLCVAMAGMATCLWSQPALGQATAMLVADLDSDFIVRYEFDSCNPIDHFVGNGISDLDNPSNMAIGPDGNLYVNSFNTDSVMRYNGRTGQFIDDFVPPTVSPLDGPNGLTFGPDVNGDGVDELYVSSGVNNQVLIYRGDTGLFIGCLVCPDDMGAPSNPAGITFGPDGNLYVASFDDDTVRRYNGQTGVWIDNCAEPGSCGLDGPAFLVFGSDGNLYVTSFFTDSVIRYNCSKGECEIFAGGGGLDEPAGMTFGPDFNGDNAEDLYVCSRFTASVFVYDGTNGNVLGSCPTPESGGITSPQSIVFLPPECPWDFDRDGKVGILDLLTLIASWGACP